MILCERVPRVGLVANLDATDRIADQLTRAGVVYDAPGERSSECES
jgi:hypothetical protein